MNEAPNLQKMADKKKRTSRRLSQIMKDNQYFNQAIELYIDQLRKKRDWQNLEKKLNECKEAGWPKEKLKKIFQWERKARELHNESLDKTMETINLMSEHISDDQFEKLETWIKRSSYSKKAWDKNVISINDNMSLIKAKIIHLAYTNKSENVNIGEIIKK